MAGLTSYERMRYREISRDNLESTDNFLYTHHGREVIRPLDVPREHPLIEDVQPVEDNLTVKRYIGLGCGLASLITENLLIHPFVVLQRQCQVNPGSIKYHIVPVTLIPVILRLHQTQGINTLWKGIGSVLLVRGMTLAVEDLVSKITPWPKEVTSTSSIKAFGGHILLKCVAIALVTPFYSASLVETVQSEIASERPGILDVFRDGAIRLLEVSNKGRLIPIYALLPPTVAYGVCKYLFGMIVRRIINHVMLTRERHSQEVRGACRKDLSETVIQHMELRSTVISMFIADVVFYPLETIIHRLHLQGTRTIIDDLDTGRSVTPLLTGYSGASDCYASIVSTEGLLGLYKGFGALITQFAVHVAVLRATKWILTELVTMLKPPTKKPKQSQYSYYTEM